MVLFGGCMVLFAGCMVLFGGHTWFYSGGMRGFFSFFGYNEIRSMSAWYASYWNAFLLYYFDSYECRAMMTKGMVFRYTWVYSKEDTMAHTRRLVVTS